MATFKATTQYGDWKGSASADRADEVAITEFLRKNGQVKDNEFVVGANLWVGENHAGKLGRTAVTAYVIDLDGHRTVPEAIAAAGDALQLRKVAVDVTLEQFLGLFKRFSVSLSAPELAIEGREFTESE
ncbi:hypothetical protein [Burkholderia sp. Tr-20355]|uniref:hypothetical protein n=1 Tax=Burkholderia sp. Tr-20355 TaxID=2703895 RepID=UPI00197E0724|nr:hypothetical protein [Burkholderia sp. Tr-20355]MBN3738073.1 hypothetical protein [Burkholderia sp. Tr-20355]